MNYVWHISMSYNPNVLRDPGGNGEGRLGRTIEVQPICIQGSRGKGEDQLGRTFEVGRPLGQL